MAQNKDKDTDCTNLVAQLQHELRQIGQDLKLYTLEHICVLPEGSTEPHEGEYLMLAPGHLK